MPGRLIQLSAVLGVAATILAILSIIRVHHISAVVNQRLGNLKFDVQDGHSNEVNLESWKSETTTTLSQIESRLKAHENEITLLRKQMYAAVNTTVLYLNTTVSEAKDSMQQEFQYVDAAVDEQGSLLAYQAAGFFTVLTVLTFLWHMSTHLREMHDPNVQRKILAILWMCPIYGITSWLSLIVGKSAPAVEWYLAVIKDCYEAYLIYMFLSFLIAVLGRGGGRPAVVDLLMDRADNLRPPLDFFGCFFNEQKYDGNPRGRADAVLYQCQFCAIQFVFLRPITSLGMALSNQINGTDWTWSSPQFIFINIQNVSIFVAFSGLLKFYHATREDLSWCNPFPKFLCIKGVVFMTFWQQMVIAVLARAVFTIEDIDEWCREAQNFLICLEMLFFAIAHCFVFPTEEWKPGYRPRIQSSPQKFGDNIALRDFAKDVKFMFKSRNGIKVKRKEEESSLYTDVSGAAAAVVEWGCQDDEILREDGLNEARMMKTTSGAMVAETKEKEANMEMEEEEEKGGVMAEMQVKKEEEEGKVEDKESNTYVIICRLREKDDVRETQRGGGCTVVVLGDNGEPRKVSLDLDINRIEECLREVSTESRAFPDSMRTNPEIV